MKEWRAPDHEWRPKRKLHLPTPHRPWRLADHEAHRKQRRQLRRGVAAIVLLSCTIPLVNLTIEYVTGLATALATEREVRVALADSIQQLGAVLDQRVERDFDLRRADGEQPPLPVMGRVTSGFSNRRLHPVLKLWRAHEGVDIPARPGTPVRAVVPGRVEEVGRDFGFGRYVVVRHGAVRTRYAHLQRTLVNEGAWITPETVLGLVGSTGLASSPHLHYEVELRGQPRDPLRYVIRMVEIVPAAIRREATPEAVGPDTTAASATSGKSDAPPPGKGSGARKR